MSQINKTIDLLKKRAANYFPEFQEAKLEIKELPFNEASTYPVHLVEITGNKSRRKLVIKFAPMGSDFCEGLVEYTNMRSLQENHHDIPSNIGLINCLDYIQESNALVMEFSEGSRFSNWFLTNNSIFADKETKNKIEYYIETSGLWLQNFHDCNKFPEIKIRDSNIVESMSTLFERTNRMGLLQSIHSDIEEKILSKIDSLSDYTLPMALIHGDFGLQNINIQNDKVYVFDLQRDYQQAIYYDVAYFCVTLQTLNPYPKKLLFDRFYAKSLQEKFLAGYFSRKLEKHEQELLDIYILLNLIQRCIKQYQNNQKRFGQFTIILVKLLNFKFEKIISNLLNTMI